jgi:hypothetical protein
MPERAKHVVHFGKSRRVVDSRTLQLNKYFGAKLPKPPQAIDWGKAIHGWPMYANNIYADCTCAAAAHMIISWTTACKARQTSTETEVLDFYKHFTKPGPDNSCVVLEVLKYWRSSGLAGHKIMVFAQLKLRDMDEIKQVIALFGGCYVGLELPNFAADARHPATVPWVVPAAGPLGKAASNPKFGHCVAAVGYDDDNLHVVSWGEAKLMSWQFYSDYADECYALLSSDFLAKNETPSGLDLAQLKHDLASVEKQPSNLATIHARST